MSQFHIGIWRYLYMTERDVKSVIKLKEGIYLPNIIFLNMKPSCFFILDLFCVNRKTNLFVWSHFKVFKIATQQKRNYFFIQIKCPKNSYELYFKLNSMFMSSSSSTSSSTLLKWVSHV